MSNREKTSTRRVSGARPARTLGTRRSVESSPVVRHNRPRANAELKLIRLPSDPVLGALSLENNALFGRKGTASQQQWSLPCSAL